VDLDSFCKLELTFRMSFQNEAKSLKYFYDIKLC
jgi:hypothetical protein